MSDNHLKFLNHPLPILYGVVHRALCSKHPCAWQLAHPACSLPSATNDTTHGAAYHPVRVREGREQVIRRVLRVRRVPSVPQPEHLQLSATRTHTALPSPRVEAAASLDHLVL